MAARLRKKIFLTGASSGIGQAAARLLLENGGEVGGTSRNPARLIKDSLFHPLEMTLENPASVSAAWAEALRQAGHFDVVIQNAGSGIFGAIEDVSADEAQRLWSVLVEGPRQILQLAAAHLRPRRMGLIIGVSSLAAELPLPFSAHYSAGKAAFSVLLAGLSIELAPFRVHVTDLRPGDICTEFMNGLPCLQPETSPYLPWSSQVVDESTRLMKEAPAPALVARAILELVEQESPPPIKRVGTFFQATLGPLGPRLLPPRALLASIRRYYGLHHIDERKRA
jgi:NAD(P)-dependent dehydrogenase (short-subunit alcohol dehydrogenase family)